MKDCLYVRNRECLLVSMCRIAGVYVLSMSCAQESVHLLLVCFVNCRLIITSSSLRLAAKGRESREGGERNAGREVDEWRGLESCEEGKGGEKDGKGRGESWR